MSSLIASQSTFLSALLNNSKEIKKATKNGIKAIVEIVYNLYHNNVNLTDTQKSKLLMYKRIILALLVKNTSLKEKRKLLTKLSKTDFFKTILEPISQLIE